jgi:hypothetical protein
MSELRCYVFIDSLQPQFASFLGTVAQGFLPTQHQAALFVEIAPGMDINKVTDVALKATNVTPGMMIIERLYGMLEIHSSSQADVRQAGRAILESLELKEEDRIKPKLLTSQVIRNISDYHSQLINRTRHGNMILPGHSLYVMECAPPATRPSRPTRRRRRPTSTSWKCAPSAASGASTWAARSATSRSATGPRSRRWK